MCFTRNYVKPFFRFYLNEMASSDSSATTRATKRSRRGGSSPLPLQEKYSFKGKRLTSQTKRVLMNVVEYFENEAKKSKGHSNVLERTSKATGKTGYIAENYMNWLAPKGISKASIKNIQVELEKKGGSFISPKKRYSESRVRKDADSFSREALRRKIHYLYANRENLSLDKILVCHHATWLLSQFYSSYVLYIGTCEKG